MSSLEHQNKKQKFSQKNYYVGKVKRRQFLESGMRGFLATCNFREKEAIRESYNILNQYADELYGEEDAETVPTKDEKNDETDNDLDINDVLDQKINAIKPKSDQKTAQNNVTKRRFQAVDTGANNCVFIQTTLTDPVQLGKRIVDDIAKSQKQKSRFLLRLVPIEAVCRANMSDIIDTAGKLFDKHFLKEPATFSVVYNKRYNNNVQRDDIIGELAKLVSSKNIGNRVDLKQAQKTVLVEVVKGLCCIAVIEGYLQNKKYNLIEIASPKPPNDAKKEKDDPTAEMKEKDDPTAEMKEKDDPTAEMKET